MRENPQSADDRDQGIDYEIRAIWQTRVRQIFLNAAEEARNRFGHAIRVNYFREKLFPRWQRDNKRLMGAY